MPVPAGALGPRFPAQPGRGPARPAGNGAEASAGYVAALENQIRSLTGTVRSLEQQLATVAQRNLELESAHVELASYRAETDRDVAERAAVTLRDAELQAQELAAAAERRAARLEDETRARSLELIAAVGAEIDALEHEAEKLRRREAAVDAAADGDGPVPLRDDLGVDAAAAANIRGQISDLLRLRESILSGIRGAVDGFGRELDELEKPPLAAAADPVDPADRADPGSDGIPAERNGFAIEIQVSPVAGVLEASRIEQNLAGIASSADAHLRSVENGSATLSVWGLGAQELRDAISSRFPGASCEWVAEDRVTIQLASAEVA